MARKKKPAPMPVEDYRHDNAKRKNNPPAKLAAEGSVPVLPKAAYSYSPRLPPRLRFDATGASDRLPELLDEATRRPLTSEEARLLADALRKHEPWLEWAGKRELPGFAVDPVALHTHERVSTQAIIAAAARRDVERSLFADPELDYREAVQFYRHDVKWSNRLILGDSLLVMSSLARREDLAGKVQMIYLDPPYGIKFASNFQPEVGKRDVKDKETDLTREAEMVKAFRDTWHLGVHSYLNYLRDRLMVAKELLADTGSIFVQISDENLHRVRQLLDELYGRENFVSVITFAKTSGSTQDYLSSTADYLLWYAKDLPHLKYRPLFKSKLGSSESSGPYSLLELPNGERRRGTSVDEDGSGNGPEDAKVFRLDNLQSQSIGREKGEGAACWFPVDYKGRSWLPSTKSRWKTNEAGMQKLRSSERLECTESGLYYVRFLEDFPVLAIANSWADTVIAGFTSQKMYVVETSVKVVQRCMLMTTDPGDLVLDPTCGSGTTAYVAEQWGRRWITIDTSRVAIAIARQRLLTAKFDYYRLRDEDAGISSGFRCKSVPHVTLKSIAQNTHLDPIFAKHEPILEDKLAACNAALAAVSDELRRRLALKLLDKQRAEGKRAVTEADRRRWDLPKNQPQMNTDEHRYTNAKKSKKGKGKDGAKIEGSDLCSSVFICGFNHWTVPFDTDTEWPAELQQAVTAYRQAWRAKMDEVNGCIAANAEQEELVDQPETVRNVVRVSGPFTVEGVQPPEISLGEVVDTIGAFGGEPEEVGPAFEMREARLGDSPQNVEAYLERMVRLLRSDGVRFPDNKQMRFSRLEAIFASGQARSFHAEGRWTPEGENDAEPEGSATVGVVFGPQFGPVTEKMIEALIRPASRRYEALVIAAFSFTAEAQALIEENPHEKLRLHLAHIRPDVNPGMDGLLKEQPGGQLFTVFGQPRTRLEGPADGEYRVVMEGVDIYNPVDNSITPTRADKVAAWFLDSDYDGRAFCITQAFFPDPSAWEKLSKALAGVVDGQRFAAFGGTESLPFQAGKHGRAAVKVIDPRGNEVMRVHELTTDEHR